MPSPLPFLSLASDLPKLSVVFAINAKLTVLVVEKHGEARLDFKPYHHWTLKAKKTKFVIMYGLTFFFAKFGPNNTYFVVLVEIFPARFRPTCHRILATTRKVAVVHSSFFLENKGISLEEMFRENERIRGGEKWLTTMEVGFQD
ncbi:hypothetical protein LguiB_004757 [Lonicera macranthoides]